MSGRRRLNVGRISSWRLSLFEKVILVNTLMLIGEALLGLWITSHSLEVHHYLIDTSFIVSATVLSLLINVLLLRASFRPLFSLLATIREVSTGKTEARAANLPTDTEIGELAQTFNSMLDRLENIRKEQAMLIVQAQEEERRRVALELHDESGQNLTALLVHTEILQQSLSTMASTSLTPEARETLRAGLAQLARLTQNTLESVRTLALQLRPAILDDLGLHAALRWLAEDARRNLHLEVDLHISATTEKAYSPLYEITLFRVAQESLTNVARHAQATRVLLELIEEKKCILLRIRDDGQGYDVIQRRSGLGIGGMRERVTLLDGTFDIRSEAGQGTLVEATLPLLANPERSIAAKDEIYARS